MPKKCYQIIFRFIDKEDIDSQLNHEKILRIACLVQDIPDELPLTEKARAWRHLLDADWVHTFGDSNETDGAIHRTATSNPELGDMIRKIQFEIFQDKTAQLDTMIGADQAIPSFRQGDVFDFEAAMKGYTVVLQKYPEAIPTYNSIMALAMSSHRMRGEQPYQ